MLKTLSLILFSLALYAADAVTPLPSEARRVVADRDAVVAKAKVQYDAAEAKAKDLYDAAEAKAKGLYDAAEAKADADAVKNLEPVILKLTKSGDLTNAVAVTAVKDGMDAGIKKMKALADAEPIGKWVNSGRNGEIYIIRADGTGDVLFGDGRIWMTFTWTVADDTIVMHFTTCQITLFIGKGKNYGQTHFVINGIIETGYISKKSKAK